MKNKEEPKEKELKNVMPEEVSFKKEDSEQKCPKEKEKFKKEEPKEDPKEEELTEKELKNKVDLKKEESEQKKAPKEKELKNLKKEEPKKEDSQEVDAVEYILREAKEEIEKYKNDLHKYTVKNIKASELRADKIFNMIELYFNKIKQGTCICKNSVKGLIDYFNGNLKMQSKNIYCSFSVDNLLTILHFDKCSCYINVYYSDQSEDFYLQSMVVEDKSTIDNYRHEMPVEGEYKLISRTSLETDK